MPGSHSSASLRTLRRPTRSPFVVAARYPANHPGQDRPRHRIVPLGQPVDLQRHLALATRRSHPRPLDPDLLAGDRDHSSLLAMTGRFSLRGMLIPAAAQPLHFIPHHQRGKLQTDGHSKTMQPFLHLSQHLGSIQRQLHRVLRRSRPTLHSLLRLSMELLLIPSPHGGFPFFFPTGDYSGEGEPPLQISTTVGTTSYDGGLQVIPVDAI